MMKWDEEMIAVGVTRPAPDVAPLALPLLLAAVPAGFPSPTQDYEEGELDLNALVVKRRASTFFVRVAGDSMTDAGISPGDLLAVDKSIRPTNGRIVIAALDGQLTVKVFCRRTDGVYLVPANKGFRAIRVAEESTLDVWGVVTYVIKKV